MKKLFAPFAAFLAMVFGFAGSAWADLPTGVSSGITAAQTDGLTAIGLVAAAGAALYVIYKILKKLGLTL